MYPPKSAARDLEGLSSVPPWLRRPISTETTQAARGVLLAVPDVIFRKLLRVREDGGDGCVMGAGAVGLLTTRLWT